MKNFNSRCYAILKKVPRGRVTTYKEIARALRSKGYRAVGNAMNRNPFAPKVPCHRVVKSDGTLGGYALGLTKKREILRREGVQVRAGKVVDFEELLYEF